MIVYHTPITITTIAKNGSERFGANASCKFSAGSPVGKFMEINQFGKTKELAKAKLLEILKDGADEIIEVKE